MSRLKTVFILVLITLNILWIDCRRTSGGSSRRSSSGTRTYSRAVPTQKTHVNTQSGSNYYNNNNYYNTPRKASNVGTTPRYVMRTQPTVRQHPPPTQPTVRHYPQVTQKPVYQQSGYQQPVYTQKPVYPQQASYPQQGSSPRQPYPQQGTFPKQPYPQQNYPSLNQPTYRPYGSFTGNNYYNPGGYYQKKDHTVRNTVLAGLGGSALGMYLGYKLGGLTHSSNNPYYGGYGGGYGGNPNTPQYSVVHHYHHGDKPIVQNAVVEPNVITTCKDVNFCAPNTTPLCMTNGTIYCVTAIDKTNACNVNSTSLQCVSASITAPCLNETDGDCNSTVATTQNVDIPCVSSINVFGDFNTNRLSVQSGDGVAGHNILTDQGISNKYCVTVIAEPLVEPKNLSNGEYVRYLQENPYAKEEAKMKVDNMVNSIGSFLVF